MDNIRPIQMLGNPSFAALIGLSARVYHAVQIPSMKSYLTFWSFEHLQDFL